MKDSQLNIEERIKISIKKKEKEKKRMFPGFYSFVFLSEAAATLHTSDFFLHK